MPSVFTHDLIAERAAELCPLPSVKAASESEYYYLGAQGPDPFFFFRPGKKNFGRGLHRHGIGAWFHALMEALPQEPDARDKCLAYALGFCTHLEADAAFHPFVYRYLAATGEKRFRHQRIENDWDVYFLSKKGGEMTDFFFHAKALSKDNVLTEYLATAAKKCGFAMKASMFRRAFAHYGAYLRHFHRRRGRILSLFGFKDLYPAETPDVAILRGKLFEEMTGEEDADALLERAAKNSAVRMEEFLAHTEGSPLPPTFSRHLLTGELLS